MKYLLVALLLLHAAASDAFLIELVAGRDTTLYSDETASELSNGGGQFLFAGSTGENANFNERRGLVWFDVAGNLPAGAVVSSAELHLFVSRASPAGPATVDVSLYSAEQAWGENVLSDAAGAEGGGTAAQPGDASWQYAFYNTTPWAAPGGDFAASASATASIGDFGGYVFSGAQLTADTQGWVDAPASNFGWFLIGEEDAANTARRFYSHDNLDTDTAPTLVVEYQVVPEPGSAALLLLGAATVISKGWKKRREKFQRLEV